MQLLFYLYILKTGLKLKKCDGKVISKKTVLFVEGSEENMRLMESLLDEISAFVNTPKPPIFSQTKWCKSCGYRSYCL